MSYPSEAAIATPLKSPKNYKSKAKYSERKNNMYNVFKRFAAPYVDDYMKTLPYQMLLSKPAKTIHRGVYWRMKTEFKDSFDRMDLPDDEYMSWFARRAARVNFEVRRAMSEANGVTEEFGESVTFASSDKDSDSEPPEVEGKLIDLLEPSFREPTPPPLVFEKKPARKIAPDVTSTPRKRVSSEITSTPIRQKHRKVTRPQRRRQEVIMVYDPIKVGILISGLISFALLTYLVYSYATKVTRT